VGFTDAKHQLIAALHAYLRGDIGLFHDERANADEKNLLEQGTVTVADVIDMARTAGGGPNGQNYGASLHHNLQDWPGVTVHKVTNIQWQGRRWYLKWFFAEPDLWFISVHSSAPSPPATTPRPTLRRIR